jgi:hypothetical protein
MKGKQEGRWKDLNDLEYLASKGHANLPDLFHGCAKDQFVQTMQLNLNGQFVQICLDGGGRWSGR